MDQRPAYDREPVILKRGHVRKLVCREGIEPRTYWNPVFNLLERVCEVMLVNARHIKAVPGRKTDVKDCEWIAELLEHGLLRSASFRLSRSGSCAT